MTSIGAMVPVADQPDTVRYDPNRNPLLIHDLTATTNWFGLRTTQPQDNSQHATREAAVAFVSAVNALLPWLGFSLAEPQKGFGGWGWGLFGFSEWSSPKQLILRPDGETFAAGLIATILGNEAVYPNTRTRDWSIYALLGIPYPGDGGRSISEALIAAALPKGTV